MQKQDKRRIWTSSSDDLARRNWWLELSTKVS